MNDREIYTALRELAKRTADKADRGLLHEIANRWHHKCVLPRYYGARRPVISAAVPDPAIDKLVEDMLKSKRHAILYGMDHGMRPGFAIHRSSYAHGEFRVEPIRHEDFFDTCDRYRGAYPSVHQIWQQAFKPKPHLRALLDREMCHLQREHI